MLPPGRLVTRGAGYALLVEPDEVDVTRFERLVGEARRVSADEPERAVRSCGRRWRSGVARRSRGAPSRSSRGRRSRAWRSCAWPRWRSCWRRSCGSGGTPPHWAELETLVARDPLRERLRGLFMLALYRSGRQVEALEVYARHGRRLLVDELGIEPGPTLQELETAILRHDPALAAPPLRAAPPAEGPPVLRLVTAVFVDLGSPEGELEPEGGPSTYWSAPSRSPRPSSRPPAQSSSAASQARWRPRSAPAVRRRTMPSVRSKARLRCGGWRKEAAMSCRSASPSSQARRSSRGADGPVPHVAGGPSPRLRGSCTMPAPAKSSSDRGPRPPRATPRELAEGPEGALVLVALLDGESPPRRTFVGRVEELAALENGWARVGSTGSPRLAVVVGEPGVGKTSLVRELAARSGTDALVLTARCIPQGRATTYRPLADVLRALVGVERNEPAEAVLARLAGRELLGLTLGLDLAGGLDPREARDRLHDAWVGSDRRGSLTNARAPRRRGRPLGRASLLGLIERLAREVAAPLLLVATTRPDLFDREPGFGRAATRVAIEPLAPEEAEELLHALAGELPPAVEAAVLSRAEGNPFFVEELLHELHDRGVVGAGTGEPTAEVLAGLAVPDSIQAVIAARLDLLSAADRAVLQAGAVVGRVFSAAPVLALADAPDADLSVLEQRDFVRARPGSTSHREREYAFKHALTREVAYGSLTAARRARLHAGFADWLEEARGGRDDDASVLAQHLIEAARLDRADLAWKDEPERLATLRARAAAWSRRAAELAVGRYELAQALELLDRALELADDPAARIEILRETARVRMLGYDPDGFREALEAALALDPPRPIAAAIYGRLAQYGAGRAYMWRTPPSDQDAHRWLRAALELAGADTRARADALVALALSRPEEGEAAVEEALAIAERLGDPALVSHALEARVGVATLRDDFATAARDAERALELAPQVGELDGRASNVWFAGFAFLRSGRHAEAAAAATEHERIAQGLTPHHDVHSVALHAAAAGVAGRWEGLVALAARAEEAAEANSETPCQFNWRTLLVCALGQARLGDADERPQARAASAQRGRRRRAARARAGTPSPRPSPRRPRGGGAHPRPPSGEGRPLGRRCRARPPRRAGGARRP